MYDGYKILMKIFFEKRLPKQWIRITKKVLLWVHEKLIFELHVVASGSIMGFSLVAGLIECYSDVLQGECRSIAK
jgi:hypothetical protein